MEDIQEQGSLSRPRICQVVAAEECRFRWVHQQELGQDMDIVVA